MAHCVPHDDQGLQVVRAVDTDELHVIGDWRAVFPEGRGFTEVKVKDLCTGGTDAANADSPPSLAARSRRPCHSAEGVSCQGVYLVITDQGSGCPSRPWVSVRERVVDPGLVGFHARPRTCYHPATLQA